MTRLLNRAHDPALEEVWNAFEDAKDDVRFLIEWIGKESTEGWEKQKAVNDLNEYRRKKAPSV